MNKEAYQAAEMNIILFQAADVILTSESESEAPPPSDPHEDIIPNN